MARGPADRARGVRPDPYRVWLSEVMLQQTTVAAVGRYYARFTALWPTVADLAAAPLEAVLVEWAGLGYYARARNLHACAVAVVERFGGAFPTSSTELLTLPGIGPYTAAAIAAITADERVAVVDGNVDRVVARYLALELPVREAKDLVRETVQQAVPARAGDFAQALMDLGATICAPRQASCLLCPLEPACAAAKLNPLVYPVKAEKAERPTRYGHAFVMRDATATSTCGQRAEKGLLAQMTETPVSDWTTDEAAGGASRLPPTGGMPRADRPRLHPFPAGAGGVVGRGAGPIPLERRLVGRSARTRTPRRCPACSARCWRRRGGVAPSTHCARRNRRPPVPCAGGEGSLAVNWRSDSGRKSFHLRAHLLAEMSMGASLPPSRACQKVQPLQASAPCTRAPTRWIEPICWPETSEPSERTSALKRWRSSNSSVPGAISPISTSEPKATRGAWRLETAVSMVSALSGLIWAMRFSAPAM